MMNATRRGKPDAGNPHVRLGEGNVATGEPRRGFLLCKKWVTTGIALLTMGAFARVSDGLFFDLNCLGDANGNGKAELTELANGMAVGSASGGTAIYGRDLFYSTETKWRSFYENASPVKSAVCITQTWYEVDMGGGDLRWKSHLNALVFQNPAATASCEKGRTMFCRFRWDGYAYPNPAATKNMAIIASDSWSWSKSAGYGFYVTPYGATASNLGVWVGRVNNSVKRGTSIFLVNSNQWYDVMFRLTPNGSTTTVNMIWGYHGIYDEWDGLATFNNSLTPEAAGQLIVGGEGYNSYSVFKKTEAGPKSFNGRIAELKIWNRALSDDEAKAVFAASWGESVAVGAANGSSDEFGVSPVEEFDPSTMTWGQMRKALTSVHPSLKIATAFRAEETEIGKSILLTPILTGLAACDVQLYVNGALEMEKSVTNGVEAEFRIKKKYWKAGADGKVHLELRRSGDMTGTLDIDALAIGGSWQIGKCDNSWVDFAWEEGVDAKANYYVGDADTSNHLRRAIYEVGGTKPQKEVVLNAYVPASLVGVKSVLGFKFLNKNTGSATSPWTIKLNGVTFWTRDLAKGDVVEVEIPANTLKAGLNTFSFSHASPQTNEWAGMDYYRLRFEDVKKGFLVIVK